MTEKSTELNCLGLRCPLPVMRLEKAQRMGMASVKIITDDPVSIVDIPAFCTRLDHAYVQINDTPAGEFHFIVTFHTAS